MMMWHYPEGMNLWFLFGSIWMVAFWGGIIALIVWGVNKLSKRNDSLPKGSLLLVAKQRYANGGISREEFKQMEKDLS